MNRRIIEIYYDINNKRFYDASGNIQDSGSYPYIYFQEKPLVQLHLVTNQALAAYTGLTGGESFEAVIEYDFATGTTPLCRTYNSDINLAGDWAATDATQGKLSVRLDASNTRFQEVIGTSAEKSGTQFELVARNISGDVVFVVRFLFRCYNLMSLGTQDPPAPESEYYKKDEVDAQFMANRANGQGFRKGESGFLEMYFPDGKWYRQTPLIVNGEPTTEWQEVAT
jgi:hypothetical protein